ncbi:hypothetical protein D3C86_2039070 [compost metagenome]
MGEGREFGHCRVDGRPDGRFVEGRAFEGFQALLDVDEFLSAQVGGHGAGLE